MSFYFSCLEGTFRQHFDLEAFCTSILFAHDKLTLIFLSAASDFA
jgi:hypothetical protein